MNTETIIIIGIVLIILTLIIGYIITGNNDLLVSATPLLSYLLGRAQKVPEIFKGGENANK